MNESYEAVYRAVDGTGYAVHRENDRYFVSHVELAIDDRVIAMLNVILPSFPTFEEANTDARRLAGHSA